MISWKQTNLWNLPSDCWVRYEIWGEEMLGYAEIRDSKNEGFVCKGVWMEERFCVLPPIAFKGSSERTFNRHLKRMMLIMSVAVCK